MDEVPHFDKADYPLQRVHADTECLHCPILHPALNRLSPSEKLHRSHGA